MSLKRDFSWWAKILLLIFLLSALCPPLFHKLTYGRNPVTDKRLSDNIPHARYVTKGVEKGQWPQHFLYQWILYAAALGSANIETLKRVSIGVLTCLVIWKALLSFEVLSRETGRETISFLAAIALTFATPIMNWWAFPKIYFGQMSPTVWHNPTTLLAMPLAALLFYSAMRILERPSLKQVIWTSFLVVLNICAKPSYLMGFLPVMAIVWSLFFWKKKTGPQRAFTYFFILFLPALLLLFYQYRSEYVVSADAHSIVWSPMTLWNLRTPHVFYSILVSIAFPLIFTLVYFKEARRDFRLFCAWGILAASALIFTFFAESGRQAAHGNFAWGNHISIFVLFLVTAAAFLKQNFSKRYAVVLSVFLAHVGTGIFYFIRQWKGLGYD